MEKVVSCANCDRSFVITNSEQLFLKKVSPVLFCKSNLTETQIASLLQALQHPNVVAANIVNPICTPHSYFGK